VRSRLIKLLSPDHTWKKYKADKINLSFSFNILGVIVVRHNLMRDYLNGSVAYGVGTTYEDVVFISSVKDDGYHGEEKN